MNSLPDLPDSLTRISSSSTSENSQSTYPSDQEKSSQKLQSRTSDSFIGSKKQRLSSAECSTESVTPFLLAEKSNSLRSEEEALEIPLGQPLLKRKDGDISPYLSSESNLRNDRNTFPSVSNPPAMQHSGAGIISIENNLRVEIRSLQDAVNSLQLECVVLRLLAKEYLKADSRSESGENKNYLLKCVLENAPSALEKSLSRTYEAEKKYLKLEARVLEQDNLLSQQQLHLQERESVFHLELQSANKQINAMKQKHNTMAMEQENEINAMKLERQQMHTRYSEITQELNALRQNLKSKKEATKDADAAFRCFAATGFDESCDIGKIASHLTFLSSVISMAKEVSLELSHNGSLSSRVTHLIVPQGHVRRVTMKVLHALVTGIWVLPSAYLEACVEHRCWVGEREYGTRYAPPPFLDKRICVSLRGRHESTALDIVNRGGGILVSDPSLAEYVLNDWKIFTRDLLEGRFKC